MSIASPSTGAPVRVAIADDHAVVRRGLRTYFETEADLDLVGEAADGPGLAALCRELHPDVALVDLIMPGGGVAAIRAVRAASPDTRIVVLTSSEDPVQALTMLEAGALSYLFKDVAPEELARAVRLAAQGQACLHPRIASHVVGALHERATSAADPLSQREREVVLLIAQGLSNQQISERLGIGEKTVKSHVGNILLKLDLADRTQAAVHAWRMGWISD